MNPVIGAGCDENQMIGKAEDKTELIRAKTRTKRKTTQNQQNFI